MLMRMLDFIIAATAMLVMLPVLTVVALRLGRQKGAPVL